MEPNEVGDFLAGAFSPLTGQESEGRKLIWDAVDAAEFLFGSALQAEVKEVLAKARRIQFLDLQYDRLQKKETQHRKKRGSLARELKSSTGSACG